MKILAIGAHPDDIEIGCGGTLLKYGSDPENEIYTLLMTYGQEFLGGQLKSPIRYAEHEASSRILGVTQNLYGNFSDTCVPLKSAIDCIERALDIVNPDWIFTHFGEDTHQDHRIISQATQSACRSDSNVLFYEAFSSQNFCPTVFVDISEFIDQKLAAIQAHVSQAHLGIKNYAESVAVFRAHRLRAEHVEGFMPWKFLLGDSLRNENCNSQCQTGPSA